MDGAKERERRLAEAVRGTGFAGRVAWLDGVDSTSDELWRRVADGLVPPAAVGADAQRAGRGRQGRSWFSPRGGLYLSALLADPGGARVTLVPFLVAVAAAEALSAAAGCEVDLKWPNDLLVGRRKLGGILSERRQREGRCDVVVGLGLNVARGAAPPPPEVADRLAWLEDASAERPPRWRLAAAVLGRLDAWYPRLLRGDGQPVLDAWRARSSAQEGRRVRVDAGAETREGVTAGVDDAGALWVRTATGARVRIVAGTVELLD